MATTNGVMAPTLSTSDFSIVSDIDGALKFIEDVAAPNVGVLIETFHVWECANLDGQIARAKRRIAGVQLSDSARFARSIVARLPPGEGVIDMARIVRLIEANATAAGMTSRLSRMMALSGTELIRTRWRRGLLRKLRAGVSTVKFG